MHPSLRDRNVALFVGVSLLSGFGGAAMMLTAGIWGLDLTSSSGLAGLAGLCIVAPTLADALPGTVVDRFPRRAVLVATILTVEGALLCLLALDSAARCG